MLLPPSIPSPRDLGAVAVQAALDGADRDNPGSDGWNEAPPETPRDLFDLLRAARDPGDGGRHFRRRSLRDQVATLILAGHETTAVTLFWAVIMLAQAPDGAGLARRGSQRRTGRAGERPCIMADLVRTRAVVNETLRLFPAAFTIAREAIAHDRAGDIELPPRFGGA